MLNVFSSRRTELRLKPRLTPEFIILTCPPPTHKEREATMMVFESSERKSA